MVVLLLWPRTDSIWYMFTCGTLTYVLKLQWLVKTLKRIPPNQIPGYAPGGEAASRKEANCRSTTTSTRSRSRPWVLSMSRPLLFCTIWVGEFRLWAGRTESLRFCLAAFQSPFTALTRCFLHDGFCHPSTRISVCSRLKFSLLIFAVLGNIPIEAKTTTTATTTTTIEFI